MTFDDVEEVVDGLRGIVNNMPKDKEGKEITSILKGALDDIETLQADMDEPDDDEGDEDDDE